MLGRIKRTIKKLKGKRFLYAWYYKKCRVVKNRILFESFHGQNISDSSYFMLLALMKRKECADYEIYYASSKGKLEEHRRFAEENHLPVKLVAIESLEYLKIMATAEYLFNNNSFPAYFIRKEDQKYLQTWHGTPLKTLGKQMREGLESMFYAQHSFLQASHLLFPNEFTRDALMRDYNLNNLYTGKTVLCGYPRNSIFFDAESAENIRSAYGLENKQVFAYMPTWRGANTSSVDPAYEAELRGILDQIDEVLKDDQVLYVNFHQLMRGMKGLDNYKHIHHFPKDVNNYAFLNCADALVTDYSSVMFDYSITGKPIILFIYDYDEYMRERGVYFDIRDLPFLFARTTEELIDYLTGKKPVISNYEGTPYCSRFLGYDAADTPDRMLDVVLHGKEDQCVVTDYSNNKLVQRRVLKPSSISDAHDLAAIDGVAGETDIVLLNRSDFNGAVREAMHATYNDRFDYVIRTKADAVSYGELLLMKLGSKKTKQTVHKRELRRLFSDLPVEEKMMTDIFTSEVGCSVRSAKPVKIQASLVKNGTDFILKPEDTEKWRLEAIILVSLEQEIIAVFEKDRVQTKEGIWRISANEIAPLLKMNKSYAIGGAVVSKKDGAQRLAYFKEPALGGHTIDTIYQADAADCFLEPVKCEDNASVIFVPYPRKWMDSFFVAKSVPADVLDWGIWGFITSWRTRGTAVEMEMTVPAVQGMTVDDVILRHRGKEELFYSMETRMEQSGKAYRIRASIDFAGLELKPVYWDPYVICTWNGNTYRIRTHFVSTKWKMLFYLRNLQIEVGDGFIVFPQYRNGDFLAYTYRESSPYDSRIYVLKEAAAYGIFRLFGGRLKKKKIWLVFEKQSNSAQDNGYYFFKYCMEQLPEKERARVFYIMHRDSPDWNRVSQYGKQVVPFMSFRHLLYLLAARLFIGSESKMHIYVWRAKISLVRRQIRQKEIMFLQHGVTALKQDHAIFGALSGYPMDYFVTTSQFEHDIIEQNFGYPSERIPITGFARWDVLEDKSTEEDRDILIMPTWRAWLEEANDEAFVSSDYYRNYSALLQEPALTKLLEQYDCRVIFYLHPKFAGHMETFIREEEERQIPAETSAAEPALPAAGRVRLVRFGEEPLNEIMMRARMLITDYSSVCWDMYYQKKPVLFYQFDLDQYNEVHGSYIDMRTELFGRRTEQPGELLPMLEEIIRDGFRVPEEDLSKYDYYFAFADNHNSERIYQYLKSRVF